MSKVLERTMVVLSVEGLLAYGPLGLFLVAFTESTVFPIPPDVLLLPLAIMSPRLSWWYALLATAASVLGALLGYVIGRKAGRPVLHKFFKEDVIEQVEVLFGKYGGWAVGIAAFTPIPYKVFTFGAGIFRVPLLTFTVVSVMGRSARFFLEGALVYFLGDKAQAYLGTKFEIATLALTAVLLLATWLLPKMLPSQRKAGAPAQEPRTSAAYARVSRVFRGLGMEFLVWAAIAAVLAVFAAAFIEDVTGPERDALNRMLGPAFSFIPAVLSGSGPVRLLASPWFAVPVALAGWAAYIASAGDAANRKLAASAFAGTAVVVGLTEAVIHNLLRVGGGDLLLLAPYLSAIGIYMAGYRRAAWWRKAGLIPASLLAVLTAAKTVFSGELDPAAGAASFLVSALMFCATTAVLVVLQAREQ